MAGKIIWIPLILLCMSSVCLFPGENNVINAQFIKEKIKIDGNLDDTFYKTLRPVDNFYQFHPKNGAKPTFKTRVYTFYDRRNIYFSFQCFDDEPKKIAADITPFGGYVNNDEVTVYIDSYLDKQTYKRFSVNPKGVKSGEPTVWDAAAVITPNGWNAEFKIPFKSLRFPVSPVQHWAVNMKRIIFRLNETCYWTNVKRDRLNVFADTFGKLEGIQNIKGGKNIEMFPYAGYRNSYSDDGKDNKFAYGMDLKYGITSNLTLDLTSSPDYSEVESDPFFYQLTPREVNLQENRPFYYEGADYFDTSFQLFYSRRINNPSFAVKLTGKEKGFSLGSLFAKNNREGNNPYHGVFRLKKDILKLSYIGIIYSSIEEKGNWNRNAGIDFDFRFRDIYSISGMVAFSYNKGLPNSLNGMYSLHLMREVDKGLTLGFMYNRIDPNVYVPAGYITKLDFQRWVAMGEYSLRWEGKWLEKLALGLWKNYETAVKDHLMTEDTYVATVDLFFKNQFLFYASCMLGNIRPQVLDKTDELVWEDKLYPMVTTVARLSYNGSRLVEFGISAVTYRDFIYNEDFTGTKKGKTSKFSLWANFKISPQLQLNVSGGRTVYKSKDNSIRFKGELFSSSLNYQLGKKISSFINFQYDSYLKRFQYDFLIGYEPANMSKIYLSIKNYSTHRFRLFSPDVRSVTFKISYLIRL